MHFLSWEIIFHVRCRWWWFLHSFWRNKGQIFQSIARAWHRNEAPKSAIWFGSSTYRLHRYRCNIGTGFRYPTLRLHPTSSTGTLPHTTVSRSERKVFITFEIWIFFLQKHMDSLQEAFIHAPELCDACFITDARALFNVFWTVEQKHPPTAMIELRSARTIFNITPTGFVWKKKVIYT